jgi:Pvc16 N-terminal domain
MTTTTNVPRATAIADLDESVHALLRRELSAAGLDVEVAFDAPNQEWSAALNGPAINAFLYDLRQAKDHRPVEWDVDKVDGRTTEQSPPLMLEATYALSAWAPAVEDEHRLLSQIAAILYAYPRLPQDVLQGSLSSQPYPLTTKVALPSTDGKADFWSSIGGTYKASIDYAVTVAVESGLTVERGPEIRTQSVRVRQIDGPRSTMVELYRGGGWVRTATGEPVTDAWVVLPEVGRWTSSGADGRFRFDRVPPGAHECTIRTADGQVGHGELTVPGQGVEITLEQPRRRTRQHS